MKYNLLKFICCPKCKSEFKIYVKTKKDKEIFGGSLICKNCNSSFPIIRGIPRILDSQKLTHIKRKVGERFGTEWKLHGNIYSFYKKQFLDWISPFNASEFKNKIVLDAGCGKGRHLVQVQKLGAKEIIGIDIGNSVEVAFENTMHLSNVHVIQGDIYFLPFKNIFDIVYSIGVIHHLPSPYEGFKSLTSVLKEKGKLIIWVYAREGNDWIIKYFDPLRRNIFSKINPKLLYYISYLPSILVYLSTRTILKKFFYREYLNYISKFPFKEIHHIVYDQMNSPLTHYISREEIEKWKNEILLKEVSFRHHNKNSWSCIFQKSEFL